MRKWFVHDSDGREIYLTEEQWEHIKIRHSELRNHLDDVLNMNLEKKNSNSAPARRPGMNMIATAMCWKLFSGLMKRPARLN